MNWFVRLAGWTMELKEREGTHIDGYVQYCLRPVQILY